MRLAYVPLLLLPLLGVSACQTLDEELDEYRYTCSKFGHRPGSPEHTRCVEGLYRDNQNNDALREAARPHPQTCREQRDKKGRKTTYCF